jgi:glycosyltransferase involved in cell wall biosynthesis/O-antigen/teichoic acid export membrane protein
VKALQGWRLGAGLLLASLSVANLLNFVFNAYLGRVLTAADFSVVSLISTFLYLLSIPLNGLQSTANHQAAFWGGRYGAATALTALRRLRHNTLAVGIAGLICWLLLSPLMAQFFRVDSIVPIATFGMVPLVGFILAVDRGTLTGRLLFAPMALITFGEPLIKLLLGFAAVTAGRPSLSYLAVPLSVVGVFGLTLLVVRFVPTPRPVTSLPKDVPILAWRFYTAVLLSGFSSMAFLSFDVLLAKHYLPPEQAGEYALVSLVGKIVFFLGTLSSEFVIPFVSRAEGQQRSTHQILRNVMVFTVVCVLPAFVAFGLAANLTVPLLFGARGLPAIPGAPWIAAGTMCFAVARILVGYHIAKRQHAFAVAASSLVAVQVLLIVLHHSSPLAVSQAMAASGAIYLVAIGLLHLASPATSSIGWNLTSLVRLFRPEKPPRELEVSNLRVLILNWRDTRHKWAGGAEIYLHQLARRLVERGMQVTLFCGNDQASPPEEVVDGVEVIRRGGFYTVYLWAFLYYLFKLRGKFDIILDCENGVPFFSPLYSRKPIVLLLFHVHQEVFIEHLPPSLAKVATFFESKLMPWIYRGYPVATISESSRGDISALGLADPDAIKIVHPGVDASLFDVTEPKAAYPLFTYLGRLKPYKNVDVAIRAFALLHRRHPQARLIIAGEGESREELLDLVLELDLSGAVELVGRVSEAEKARLLARSWAALQPSMMEGWGMTVIEANACGTPVIAHDVKGLRDAIRNGQTGCLVPPMNTGQFAAAMAALIEDHVSRSKLEQAAVAWARTFDWDESASALGSFLLLHARA